MSSCGCDPFAPPVFRKPGKICPCKLKRGGAGPATEERTAGYITPPGQPCAFNAPRRPDGRCPGDEVGGMGTGLGQPTEGPAQWDSWTPEQRAAYIRGEVARRGGSPAEQEEAARRARESNDRLIPGLVALGVGAIRDYFSSRTQERIAEIEARARVEIARIMAQSGSQGGLMNGQGNTPGGGGNPTQQPAASGGGEIMLLPLLMMMMMR